MGLFEALEHLEDPFVGFVILDGINAREEFEVLHWHQLMTARNEVFPDAPPFHRPDESQDTTNGNGRESLVDTIDVTKHEHSPDDLPQNDEAARSQENSLEDMNDSSVRRGKKLDYKRVSVHFKTLELDDLDV